MTNHRIVWVTRLTPMHRLMAIANDPKSSFDLMYDALREVCRRQGIKPRPTPTAREVLDEVWRNECLPIELRARAAMAVLQFYPPPATTDHTKEKPDE